jgi:hypothetical protein
MGADERCGMFPLEQTVGGAENIALETEGQTMFSLVFRDALSDLLCVRPGWAATIQR